MAGRIVLRWAAAVALGSALCVSPMTAQETESGDEGAEVQKVFRLKHISPDHAWTLFRSWVGEGNLQGVGALDLLSVRGRKETVDEIERTLAEIDVPRATDEASSAQSSDANLTVYFVAASEEGEDDIPSQLVDTVAELRRHFTYGSYELLEAFSIRSQIGERSDISGLIAAEQGGPPTNYSFSFAIRRIAGSGAQRTLRVNNLQTSWRIPVSRGTEGFTFSEPALRASFDVKEGVMTVVGKAGVVGPYRGIFVVILAEVVDP